MALEIFKLVGSIFVDTDKANESMAKTDKKAESLGSKLAKGAGTAAKWGAGLVTAAGAAGTAMVKMASQSASTADNIDKMSQKIGISREAYQELSFVCSQSGTSVDGLTGGMKKLTSVLSGAVEASAEAAELERILEEKLESGEITLEEYNKQYDEIYDGAYKASKGLAKLGFSLDEMSQMSQEDALFAVITELQKMPEGVERATLAQELLGKSAQELAPLLNSGAGSLDEMRQEAHDLGLVLGDDLIDNGVNLTDAMDKLQRSAGSIVTQLQGALMPIVLQLVNYIIEFMPVLQEMFDKFAPVLVGLMESLLPALMQMVSEIIPVLIELVMTLMPVMIEIAQELLPIILELITTLLPPMIEIIKSILPVFITLLDAIMPILKTILSVIAPILQIICDTLSPIIALIAKGIRPLIEIVGALLNEALKPLGTAIKFVFGLFSVYILEAFEGVKNVMERFTGIFKGFGTFLKGVFTGDFKLAFKGLTDIVKNTFGAIVELVKAPINAMIAMLNTFIDGLNKIKIPEWVPAVGGKGINIPRIQKLYAGGVLEKGQMGLLEGNGAEAVVPLENNQKWIQAVSSDMRENGIGGFDRSELVLAIIEALRAIMPELQQTVLVLPDENGIIRLVRKASIERGHTNGRKALV